MRSLNVKDAQYMLEWMHDDSVVHDLQTDFSSKTLDDCIAFIEKSLNDKENINLAITDDKDEYMGTVSLKHIFNGSAEFAIAVRKCAMGKGYSRFGMEEIIKKGFNELGVYKIYWCVSPLNVRAVRFYDKNGYVRVSPDLINVKAYYTEKQINEYYWYLICRPEI